jgi:hypothetical protein
MPGAPNKPPDSAAVPPPPVPAGAAPVLRRLVPSRIALRLDTWRKPLSTELLTPYLSAEAALGRGEPELASGYLDQLAIRFAEPRWPTMPAGLRSLAVQVIRPQPPNWDPDSKLTPEEREAKRKRSALATHLELLTTAIDLETRKGTPTADLASDLEGARSGSTAGDAAAFWAAADRIWAALHERVPTPIPASPATPAATAAPARAEPDAGDASP